MTNQINGRETTQTSTPQPINGNNAVENPLGTPQGERYFYHLGKPTGDGVLIDAVDSDIIHLRGNMIEAFVNSLQQKDSGDK